MRAMEELAVKAVSAIHRFASLRPHQCFELAYRHHRSERLGPLGMGRIASYST
jgi:hypothetical protein